MYTRDEVAEEGLLWGQVSLSMHFVNVHRTITSKSRSKFSFQRNANKAPLGQQITLQINFAAWWQTIKDLATKLFVALNEAVKQVQMC